MSRRPCQLFISNVRLNNRTTTLPLLAKDYRYLLEAYPPWYLDHPFGPHTNDDLSLNYYPLINRDQPPSRSFTFESTPNVRSTKIRDSSNTLERIIKKIEIFKEIKKNKYSAKKKKNN